MTFIERNLILNKKSLKIPMG